LLKGPAASLVQVQGVLDSPVDIISISISIIISCGFCFVVSVIVAVWEVPQSFERGIVK